MTRGKAVIIGSGIAGLATAVRLAVKGFEVTVYEKNNTAGGKLSSFVNNGFYFDAGPSLFTQPENIEELFDLAGEPMENIFSYEPVKIACKYFYPGGKIVNAYTDRDLFAAELAQQLNEESASVIRYLDDAEKLYNKVGTVFLNHSLQKRKLWLSRKITGAIATVKYPYLFNSLHAYNRKKFNSTEAVQLFDRFATYNGSSPYKAPGILSMVSHLEHNQGVFYPKGGMISIVKALYQLAVAKGVHFYFDTPVDNIIYHEGKAMGVVVNGQNTEAAIVISNADLHFTYKKLLNNPVKAQQLSRKESSSSAFIFYWSINKRFPQLELHNIFFSDNYKNEFESLFGRKQVSGDPTIYINITSKMETAHAPEGKENWFVMINAPADNEQNWDLIKEKLREVVIKKLSGMLGENISDCIEAEFTLDPTMIEAQTTSYRGALYGSSSNSKRSAFFREPNFTSTVKGLYFCGGSVHPGGGIPLCLRSAKIVSELAAAGFKKSHH
ncbi:MAG: phytoene desaturase family protein [Ferruginibacter sp.]